MSKKNETVEAISDMLGTSPIASSEAPVKAPEADIKAPEKKESEVVGIRIDSNDKAVLKAHFEDMGITGFTTGLKMIFKKYMKENNIQ